jgi:triphosphoribosyl-dephospho-CoA synthase
MHAAAPANSPRGSQALASLPAALLPWGRGWMAALACVLEASAPKPGNVHPGAAFDDLCYDDLVAAALAIAPVMDRAAAVPLGRTILDAVAATRRVVRSNANLGIVLALAPLAAARPPGPVRAADAAAALDRLTADDASLVWEAIAIARPGGMGGSGKWDVAGPAPPDLLEAMRLAAPRDALARLWAEGYAPLFAGPVPDLAADLAAGFGLDDAIVRCHLRQLARTPDTLIARRHGPDVAADVSARAAAVIVAPGEMWREAAARFDASLRRPVRINPGTTADLVAAALYILLADGTLRPHLGC